jgi:hypothetical protein
LDSEFIIDYVSVLHPDAVTVLQEFLGVLTALGATPTPSLNARTQVRRTLDASLASSTLGVDHDDAPIRYRFVREIMEATMGDASEDLLLVDTDEPGSFQEAQGYECWRKALLDEMIMIKASETWALVDAPMNHRSIVLKWVFKTNRDGGGVIAKHKVHLVTKGYVQQVGIDFDKV